MPDSYPFAQRYTLTSGYGQRTYTLNGKVITDFHRGIDYGTPKRTPILAPFDCIVDQYIDSSQAKYCVLIRKGTNYRWDIIHVDEVVGPVGREAKQGTVVGYTGNTGKYTTGPHAHIEIRPDWINGKNVYIDPTSYLQNLPLFSELNPPQPPLDPCINVKLELTATQAKLNASENQKKELEKQVLEKDAQISSLNAQIQELESKVSDLSSKLEIAAINALKQAKKIVELEKEVETLKLENEQLKETIKQLEEDAEANVIRKMLDKIKEIITKIFEAIKNPKK